MIVTGRKNNVPVYVANPLAACKPFLPSINHDTVTLPRAGSDLFTFMSVLSPNNS